MLDFVALLFLLITLPTGLEILLVLFGAIFKKQQAMKASSSLSSFLRKTVVLIPAHNEEKLIGKTIESLRNSRCDVQILVVLDHCTDDTAAISISKGAKILERKPSSEKGKMHALKEAFSLLLQQPYEWFLVIDADSIVKKNFFEEVSKAFLSGADGIQTYYEVLNPDSSLRHRLMRVAFLAFNFLRPMGRFNLGLSCGILGNGFGITRNVLEKVAFPVDTIVEDLAYHLKIVEAGFKIDFVPSTSVFGAIPSKGKGVMTQRMRWEGGRFSLLRKELPVLLKKLVSGNFALFEPALELASLPLAFYVCILFLLCFVSNIFFQGYALFSLIMTVFYLLTAIFLGGGGIGDVWILLFAPFYVLWKLGVLFRLLFRGKSKTWEKTERD